MRRAMVRRIQRARVRRPKKMANRQNRRAGRRKAIVAKGPSSAETEDLAEIERYDYKKIFKPKELKG